MSDRSQRPGCFLTFSFVVVVTLFLNGLVG
jgi:hypothetical protein